MRHGIQFFTPTTLPGDVDGLQYYFEGRLSARHIAKYGVPLFAFDPVVRYPAESVVHNTPSRRGYMYVANRATLMVTVAQPIRVYKAVRYGEGQQALATLILPPGAIVRMWNSSENRTLKCRADHAFVEKVHRVRWKDRHGDKLASDRWRVYGRRLSRAYSGHGGKCFVYVPGSVVVPVLPFDKTEAECESGIHFFFDKARAITYR